MDPAGVTVFRGGTILTGDPTRPRAAAVAVADGRIVAVGDLADGDRTIELAGATLLPGFRDGHIHPLWGGTETLDAPVVDASDLDDLLDRVRRHAAQNPAALWVVGHGYPCELLPGAVGRAEWLDAVVGDRPVALWASDHHTLWVNSAALAVAGISDETPDPPAGEIVRDERGRAVGTLREAAMDLVAPLIPARGMSDKRRGLRIALEQMAAAGIVWAQEAALATEDVAVYLELQREGALTADINIALRVDPVRWRDQVGEFVATREAAQWAGAVCKDAGVQGGCVTVATVKFFADGVIESGTGALLEPYDDAPHSCGIANWADGDLADAVTAFDAAGFQAHIHAIGDAAVRSSLDALDTADQRNGPRDRRGVLAHTQLVHPDDHKRFAAANVIANFEPLWAQRSLVMTELTEPRLGPARSALQYPIGSLARSGAPISFGSDWPVSSMVPMEGIATAVTRQTPEGDPPRGWLPEERLTLAEAIGAYTRGGAYQGFDDTAGMLVEGAAADLVVVAGDLTEMEPSALAHAGVVSTWAKGVQVFGE
jgi:predicted amidohydrolase YtcJ